MPRRPPIADISAFSASSAPPPPFHAPQRPTTDTLDCPVAPAPLPLRVPASSTRKCPPPLRPPSTPQRAHLGTCPSPAKCPPQSPMPVLQHGRGSEEVRQCSMSPLDPTYLPDGAPSPIDSGAGPRSMVGRSFSSLMSQLPSGWSAGRRSGFACPLDAPWKAREMDEMAGDLAKRGVSPTGGCCSTPPAAIVTARRARIRPGRLYSCTRTMHNQHGKVGSAKDRSKDKVKSAYLE